MSKIIVFLLFFGVASAAGFLAPDSDIPLYPKMREVEGSRAVFDKPQGAMLWVEMQTRRPQKLLAFYGEVLPNLGWVGKAREGGMVFSREEEVFSIHILSKEGRSTRLLFHLSTLE